MKKGGRRRKRKKREVGARMCCFRSLGLRYWRLPHDAGQTEGKERYSCTVFPDNTRRKPIAPRMSV